MAHHVVDRSAYGFGEAAIIERGWYGAAIDYHLVAKIIDFLRCHSRPDDARDGIKDLSGESSRLAHSLIILLGMYRDLVIIHVIKIAAKARKSINTELHRTEKK